MERTNAQKKPKKRKKSSSKPQQKQSQKQSVVVNIADAVRRRKKSSASKSKATPMPSSQQFAQQQPQFIYATQPPVQQNQLNPSVALPQQNRPLIQFDVPAVSQPTAQPTLTEQVKNAERREAMIAKQEAMIAKQLEYNLQQLPLASAVPALVAQPMKSSALAPPKPAPSPLEPQVATLADRRLADLQMPPMMAEGRYTQLSPVEEEMLRRGRGRPQGSKDSKPRKRSTSTELAQQRADALQPFKFGGSQYEEEPQLDRYYGYSRKEGREPKLLVQRAEPTQTLAMAVQETEPAPLGLASDGQMSFM